jgi:hypothetical protein
MANEYGRNSNIDCDHMENSFLDSHAFGLKLSVHFYPVKFIGPKKKPKCLLLMHSEGFSGDLVNLLVRS